MAKLVKFTNYSDKLRGNPIYFNPEHITAAYERPNVDNTTVITVVYSAISGMEWTIEEGLNETIKLINEAKNA